MLAPCFLELQALQEGGLAAAGLPQKNDNPTVDVGQQCGQVIKTSPLAVRDKTDSRRVFTLVYQQRKLYKAAIDRRARSRKPDDKALEPGVQRIGGAALDNGYSLINAFA